MVGKHTKAENELRIQNGDINLFVTTSVMLCGVDLPRVDLVLITRPYSHISSFIQAGGRGGRLQRDDTRRRVVVYLLYNATDIRANNSHITEPVRKLFMDSACLKQVFHDYFSPEAEHLETDDDWCCSLHFGK